MCVYVGDRGLGLELKVGLGVKVRIKSPHKYSNTELCVCGYLCNLYRV